MANIGTKRSRGSIDNKRGKMANTEDLASLPSYAFKICVLGAGSVGKTSLVKTFFGQTFVDKHVPTVDDYFVHAISLDGRAYHTTCIIDTAGTYCFPAMRKLAIESSQGFLVLYALDSMNSFQEAIRLLDEIYAIKAGHVPVNLIASKLDVDYSTREVTTEQARVELNSRPWITGDYIEVSSKAQFRVAHSFHSLLKHMVNECQRKEKKKARTLLTRRMRSYKLVKRYK
ncbi:hypothetical protein QZH41_001298 [Actinostola sp. cb2023]|nr:hypothetical protein QZH41_001298 [Actinostola sp. cb2023]